jgi:PIN domain nuclease of toxin-antitoxin system
MMRLLLDTHIFIWYVTDNPKLSATTRALIDKGDNDILLSIVSIWEIAIKHSAGKLSFALPFRMFIEQQLRENSIELLNINLEHIEVVESLPFHHRDPFDRLIVAQAMVERMPVLSADSIFDAYPIRRLW